MGISSRDLGLRQAGRVRYGQRAFEQDANEAMRGHIVRGLIELITNADDAYARMAPGTVGRIRIEVEHRRGSDWTVRVRDRATGMSQSEMAPAIVELGGEVSGFAEGADVRGNRGRGAKDIAAFGTVLFESIKDDQYGAIKLLATGEYEDLPRGRRVTKDDRDRLGITRGNGTAVTVTVRDSIRCPNHSTLKRRLIQHFQLRDILSDRLRQVVLANLSNPAEEDVLVREVAETPLLRSSRLAIEGYADIEATLEIRRLRERCDEPASDPYRFCGLLIKGGRAIYENTLFRFEGNPHAAFFHGRVVCRYIDELARDYDARRRRGLRPTDENPVPIISRGRDGLTHTHPFYLALRKASEGVLEEVVREEAERARREAAKVENERTRRDLDRLAREAARFMQEELRNAEVDELPGGGSLGSGAKPLEVIPGEAIAYLGEGRTLTVVALREGLPDNPVVTISTDPEGVVELVDGTTIQLRPHRRRDNVMVGQVHLNPLVPEVTLIQCELEGRLAEALVEVREEREATPQPLPPIAFEFEKPRYRVAWTRTKTLTLRAPRGVLEAGSLVHVTSSSAGIVILTDRVAMTLDVGLGYLVGQVRVEGRALGAEATVRATQSALTAESRVVVASDDDGPSMRFEIVDKDGGRYRALWEEREDPSGGERVRILAIQGQHAALRKFLGEAPAFPGQNNAWTRLVLAEIITDNAVVRSPDGSTSCARRMNGLTPRPSTQSTTTGCCDCFL